MTERRTAANRADSTPVIVVSTGRCGSTLLSDMIRLHPSLLSLSELFAVVQPGAFAPGPMSGEQFWQMLSVPRKRWTLMLRFDIGIDEILYRPAPPARFTVESGVPPLLLVPLPHLTDDHEALFDELSTWVPELDARPIGEQYRRLFAWLCERLDRRSWVERSGSSLAWIPDLLATFPDARFVHMYRDGRDCAISMSRHNAYRLTHVSQRLFRHLGVDPYTSDDPPVRPPARALQPFMPDTFDRERYVNLKVPVEDMGRRWSNMIVDGCRRLAELDAGRVMHLDYESLAARPTRELHRLADFLGVEAGDAWLRRASALATPQPPRWPSLPPDVRRRLVEACAPGMELLTGRATGAVGA